jgi:hypothetical protein
MVWDMAWYRERWVHSLMSEMTPNKTMPHRIYLNYILFFQSTSEYEARRQFDILKLMVKDPRHHYYKRKVELFNGQHCIDFYKFREEEECNASHYIVEPPPLA